MKKFLRLFFVVILSLTLLCGSVLHTSADKVEVFSNNDKIWYDDYRAFIFEKKYLEYPETGLKEAVERNEHITFLLYDMNHDGIPELIIGNTYIRSGDTNVFTFRDGEIVYIGKAGTIAAFINPDSDYNGLFSTVMIGMSRRQYIYSYLSDEGNVINQTVLYCDLAASSSSEIIEDANLYNVMKKCTVQKQVGIYMADYPLIDYSESELETLGWAAFVARSESKQYMTRHWDNLYRDFISNKRYIDYPGTALTYDNIAKDSALAALHDFDNDGIPELLLDSGICGSYASGSTDVFTVKDGKIVLAGSISHWSYNLFSPSAGWKVFSEAYGHGLFNLIKNGNTPYLYLGYYQLKGSSIVNSEVATYTYKDNGYYLSDIKNPDLYSELLMCAKCDPKEKLPSEYDYPLEYTLLSEVDELSWDAFAENYGFKRFLLDRDTNSFCNHELCFPLRQGYDRSDPEKQTYGIPKEYEEKLFSLGNSSSIKRHINDEWGGACHGIALTMGKLYNGDLSLSDLTNGISATEYHQLDPVSDSRFDNMVNYYQLTQYTDLGSSKNALAYTDYWDFSGSETDFFKALVEQATSHKVSALAYGTKNNKGESIEHTIAVVDGFYNTSADKYVIKLYDENSLDNQSGNFEKKEHHFGHYDINGQFVKDYETGKFYYLWLNSDFSVYSAPESMNFNNYSYLALHDLHEPDMDIHDQDIAATGVGNTCDLNISLNHPFLLKNSANQTFSYDGESFSGDLQADDIYMDGDESELWLNLTVLKDTYTLAGEEGIKATISDKANYHSVIASNHSSVVLSLSDGVTVNSEKCHFDIYTATKETINELGEKVLVKVSGNAEKSVSVTPGYDDVSVSTGKKLTNISVTDYIDNQSCSKVIGTVSKSRVIPNTVLAYGDIDGDGKITILDTTLLQYYLAHIKNLEENQLIAADVNADDEIDITDATVIQRYDCKMIDKIGLDYLKLK